MAEQFETIITTLGETRIAEAQAAGEAVALLEFAAGDGNGSYSEPDPEQTALVNEVWRGNISRKYVDPANPSWVIIEAVVPIEAGPFWIREAGIFSAAGELISVGKYPATYKPVLSDGSGKDLLLRQYMEVTSADAVTLLVDPAIILATRDYVDDVGARLNRRAFFFNNTLV